jgi:hypothetical protein
VGEIPAPRLQVTDQRDLEALRRAEAERLEGYGWVDRKAGVVHIPIERAMDLLSGEDGGRRLPAREREKVPAKVPEQRRER